MRRNFLLVSTVFSLAILVGIAPGQPEPSIPPPPVVPNKVDLPPKSFTQKIGDSDVAIEMVYIPGGEFTMGSPETEAGRLPDEGPQHRVQIRPFWMAKFETTWEQFYAFWKDESLLQVKDLADYPEEIQKKLVPDAITRPTNTYVDELYDHGEDGHPALCMSHHAAMMYCHWLRWKTKLPYRLPTEAEWEYACRAGTTGPYSFPEGEKLDDYAWYVDNSATSKDTDPASVRGQDGLPTTHKVGTKKANAFGLHDMHGNVWEWCLDHWDPQFYKRFSGNQVYLNPVNKPTEAKWGHVVRGGSWADKADRLRSAARRGSDKSWMKHDPQFPRSIWWLTRMDVVGFRVALPVEEYPELVGIKPMVWKKGE
jgi:formylglycine-generating enzyme required for sulfatase activity